MLTNPQKPFVGVRKIASYAFQRLAMFGCGIRSFVHGAASPTCLAELIQSNVLDALDLVPRGGGVYRVTTSIFHLSQFYKP